MPTSLPSLSPIIIGGNMPCSTTGSPMPSTPC
jgi:hypothetical protein